MPEGDAALALAHYQAGFGPLLYGIIVTLILTLNIVVKIELQKDVSFFDHFEELLYDRIGTPPRNLALDVEQIRQSTYEHIEMNRFVVDKNPMVGLCWRNIDQALKAKFKDVPEPERQKKMEELLRQIYYVYIFLDQYSRLDELRARGLISADGKQRALHVLKHLNGRFT